MGIGRGVEGGADEYNNRVAGDVGAGVSAAGGQVLFDELAQVQGVRGVEDEGAVAFAVQEQVRLTMLGWRVDG